MKKPTNKDNQQSLLYTCAYAILGGTFISAIYPPWMIVGNMLSCGGLLTIGYSAFMYSPFDKLFRNLGLGIDGSYPFLKNKIKTNNSIVYNFTLPCGLALKDFEDVKDEIEQHLGRDISIKYTFKEIRIEVFNNKMKENYTYEPVDIPGNVPIFIGYGRSEELISCDLSAGEPHLLVSGETGSGKTTALRSITTNLILKSNVVLHLVDLKNGTEFNLFRKSSKVTSFCRTIKETELLLTELSIEVDRRYDLFYSKDVKDIIEYNKKFKYKKLNYQVVVIDEFADLQSNKNCMSALEELGRKARACGIHLILSTQRPDSKVLNGSIKANITNILGLKTLNHINSQIIIDEPGLEKLRGKGHAIFKRGDKMEIQTPFLDTDRARELIKHTYIEKHTEKLLKNGEINDLSFLEVIK